MLKEATEDEIVRDKMRAEREQFNTVGPDPRLTRPYPGEIGGAQTGMSAEYVLRELFTYHSPDPYQARQYETMRDAALHFANVIIKNTPRGADQTAAIRKIREAVMTANAAVALRGISF